MKPWQLLTIGVVIYAMSKSSNVSSRVERIAKAIAVAEGYGANPNNIPTRNNNPGNIRSSAGPIAVYDSPQAGWDALYRQVTRMLDGSSPLYPTTWTLAQVAQRYTGEAQYMNWANNVARILGVSTDIVFSQIP